MTFFDPIRLIVGWSEKISEYKKPHRLRWDGNKIGKDKRSDHILKLESNRRKVVQQIINSLEEELNNESNLAR